MAKKLETKLLITSLEKAAKTTGKAIWSDLALRLNKPLKNKIEVNLDKVSLIASKNKGKVIIVPGKILSSGELTEKVKLVAVEASETAKAKMKGKAEFITLAEYAKNAEKHKASEMIIIA
jgi:large subunit ribosomal protein L18e